MSELEPSSPLSVSAERHFVRLAEQIAHRQEPHHADTLTMYVRLWERVSEADKKLAKLGVLHVDASNGTSSAHPLWKIVLDGTKQLLALQAKLGLTPLDEAKTPKLERKPDVKPKSGLGEIGGGL